MVLQKVFWFLIPNGEPITLTQEQREQFIQIICDIPKNPINFIEEIYQVKTYDADAFYFRYRVGDVLFELPNTTFAYNLGNNDEIICKNPKQPKLLERNHPVGGYIIGMLIHLGGQERFYGM